MLVRRRSWRYHVARPKRRPRKIPSLMDRVPKPWTARRRCQKYNFPFSSPDYVNLQVFSYSLAKNHEKGVDGGVTPDTYVVLPFAFLLSPLEHVVRSDGTRILVFDKLRTRDEFKMIKRALTSRLNLLSAFGALWSSFYRLVNFRILPEIFSTCGFPPLPLSVAYEPCMIHCTVNAVTTPLKLAVTYADIF